MQSLKESNSLIGFYSNCVTIKNRAAKYAIIIASVTTIIIPIFISLAYFFMKILQNYSNRCTNLVDIGTVYEITNESGVKSYLIGSIHMTDEKMIKKSYFHRIADQCSQLYTEMGMYEFSEPGYENSPIGDKVRGDKQYEKDTYRFCLDLAISQIALAKKIPIYSLDKGLPEIDQHMEKVSKLISEDPIKIHQEKKTYWMKSVRRYTTKPEFIELHSNVIKGNVELLEKLRKPYDIENNIREDHWCKTLIPVLTNAKQPICIVVGVAHVIGEDGLASRFEQEGFTVQLIQQVSKNP